MENDDRDLDRRRFLKLGLGAALLTAMPAHAAKKKISRPERAIALHNLHTDERVKAIYWSGGTYLDDALTEISRVLRDHRTGDVHPMDPKLLDLLYLIHSRVEGRQPFHVISGYRSPKTNAMLRKHSSMVAKRSLHMQGKATDLRLPGRDLKTLKRAAVSLSVGGVGYYPRSNFIHVDTGDVRFW